MINGNMTVERQKESDEDLLQNIGIYRLKMLENWDIGKSGPVTYSSYPKYAQQLRG